MIWNITKSICTSLAIIVVAGLGIVGISTKAHHGALLSVQTKSMVPVLNKGDLVSVKRISTSALQIGDIITFVNPVNHNQTITHRVVELPSLKNKNQIVTKGDANPGSDRPIQPSSVIGVISYKLPKLGYAVDVIRKPIGLALVIYLPALLIVIGETRRLASYYKSRERYILAGYESPMEGTSINYQKTLLLILAVALPFATLLHAQAGLLGNATLTGNTILATNPFTGALISKLSLRCTQTSSATASYKPKITVSNPTRQTIDISGWRIEDNGGSIFTFPQHTQLRTHHHKVVRLQLPIGGSSGLQFVSDHLVLVTGAGVQVDGLSWGSDSTILNPAIQAITSGTTLKRKPENQDTNTAGDWKVSLGHCNDDHDGHHDDGESDDDDHEGDHDPHEDRCWSIETDDQDDHEVSLERNDTSSSKDK